MKHVITNSVEGRLTRQFSLNNAIKSVITTLALSGMGTVGTAAQLEEIIVEAQKRSENLQDVPLSISAFSAEGLENQRISELDEIATRTPNFSFSEFSSGRPELSVRGIGTVGISRSAVENSVVLFLDEVYIARSSGSAFELFDLEQVSVLRGPQGTLYGKNVVGGAVSITTAKPSRDETIAKIELGAGNFSATSVKGLVSAPLSERAAGKVSFLKKDRDGYGKDLISGQESDDQDDFLVRGQLLFDLNDNAELLVTADYSETKNGAHTRTPTMLAGDTFIPAGPVRRSNHGINSFLDTDQWGISAKLDWGVDAGTWTAIAAYRDVSLDTENIFGTGIGNGGAFDDIFSQQESADQFTLEVRYASEFDGPINFVGGAYYIDENVDRLESETVNEFDADNVLDVSTGTWDAMASTSGWAAFIDGSWDISDSFTIRAGIRYTTEDKDNNTVATLENDGDANGASVQLLQADFDVSADETFDGVTPRIVFEWKPSDRSLVYLSGSRGFKSGGFDSKTSVAEFAGTPIKEEFAVNWELGLKSQWLDDSLQVNASVFNTDYTDLQLITILLGVPVPGSSCFFCGLLVQNAGEATIQGGELEIVWLPTENLYVDFNYGYLDAEIDDFVVSIFENRAGNRLPNAPENSLSVSTTYTLPLESGAQVLFNADYAWKDDLFYDTSNIAASHQESYGIINASVAYVTADEKWKFTLWGKNLDDELYTDRSSFFIGQFSAHYAPPRTYGVSVNWSL